MQINSTSSQTAASCPSNSADKFGAAMDAANTGSQSGSQAATGTQGMEQILSQIKDLIQQLSQMIQAMSQSGSSRGGAVATGSGEASGAVPIRSVGGSGGALGGTQGPSDNIPDPTENVREIRLGGKTVTIGSDGSASAAEVGAAGAELQRMYDTSPTFRRTIDSADGTNLTVTLGRRGDNTSWGGGARVFLNLNNINAGNNDSFQMIAGHEFAHAAGLPHGAELEAIEAAVGAEA